MKRVVIIGNGPAGHRLAASLHRQAPQFDVTVLGAESRPAYNRVLLSSVLAGSLPPEAITLPPLPDAVTVHTGVRVTEIDRAERWVRTDAGMAFEYDELVLATGAESVLPAIPGLLDGDGALAEGVIAFRTLDDHERIFARLAEGSRAVVLGGGLLGVETARGLAGRGIHVSLVESAEYLMNRQLDAGAGKVLARVVEKLAVHLRLGTEVLGYRPGEVELASGETLPADALIVSAGARPNVWLAEAAGLAVASGDGGILVDDELRSSDPHIRAIGDCASHDAGTPGLLEPAWQQADVLAGLLSQQESDARYLGSKGLTRLRARDIDLATVGAGHLGDDEADVVVLSDPTRGKYAKLALRDGALAGAILLGCPEATGVVTQLYDSAGELPADPMTLLFGQREQPRELSPALLPDRAVICRCNSVTKQAIVESWHDGARTPDEISRTTRAGTGCGSCVNAVEGLCSWLKSTNPETEEAA